MGNCAGCSGPQRSYDQRVSRLEQNSPIKNRLSNGNKYHTKNKPTHQNQSQEQHSLPLANEFSFIDKVLSQEKQIRKSRFQNAGDREGQQGEFANLSSSGLGQNKGYRSSVKPGRVGGQENLSAQMVSSSLEKSSPAPAVSNLLLSSPAIRSSGKNQIRLFDESSVNGKNEELTPLRSGAHGYGKEDITRSKDVRYRHGQLSPYENEHATPQHSHHRKRSERNLTSPTLLKSIQNQSRRYLMEGLTAGDSLQSHSKNANKMGGQSDREGNKGSIFLREEHHEQFSDIKIEGASHNVMGNGQSSGILDLPFGATSANAMHGLSSHFEDISQIKAPSSNHDILGQSHKKISLIRKNDETDERMQIPSIKDIPPAVSSKANKVTKEQQGDQKRMRQNGEDMAMEDLSGINVELKPMKIPDLGRYLHTLNHIKDQIQRHNYSVVAS